MKQGLLPGLELDVKSDKALVPNESLVPDEIFVPNETFITGEFLFADDFDSAEASLAAGETQANDAKERHEDQHLLPGFSLPGYTLVGLLDMTSASTEERGRPEENSKTLHETLPESPDMRVFEPRRDAPPLPPITVIGLGTGEIPLGPEAARAVKNAEVLGLPRRLLARYRRRRALLIPLVAPLGAALQALEEHYRQGRRCVVLADGDPLLYGIGATLARRFSHEADALRILPGVSAMQTACARLRLPWNNVETVSLHGREDWMPLAHAVLSGRPVCLYTDAAHTPAHIARFLLERGVDWHRMAVAAHLGSHQETLRDLALHEAARQEFEGGETVVLLPAAPPRGPRLGLDESTLVLDGGLFTKAPVRAAALSLLSLAPDATVWDIGAGSGCLALEAAALVPRGRVCAMEQNPDRVLCIQENRRRLGIPHLDIFTSAAPLGLDALPDPDAIFLGGGLGGSDVHQDPRLATRSSLLLVSLFSRLRPGGTLVAACTLLSSLNQLSAHLDAHHIPYSVSLIQASVSAPLAASLTLKALNPIFLVKIKKE